MDKLINTMVTLWAQLQGKVEEHLESRSRGQGFVEYAFMLVFVAVACIVALGLLGGNISTLFSQIAGCIDAAAPSATACTF